MATNLELYEALKKSLNEDAARMIAEAVPAAGDIARRGDIERLEGLIERLEGLIERRLAEMEAKFLRWTLSFFVPLWLAVLGALIAVVVKA